MPSDPIPRRQLGRTGFEATVFGLGGEGVLRTYGRENEAEQVIRAALDRGVNYFDSAPAYDGCLDYLGAALGAKRRDVFLASKTHDRTRAGSFRLFNDLLQRLHTDYLDLWQLHDLRTRADLDQIFGRGGALEALTQAKAQGRVRYIGITGHHDPEVLLEAMRRFDFDTLLVALNAADVHGQSFIKTVLPEAARRGMGVIAMKVASHGALIGPGRLTMQEALSYALSLEGVSLAIVGCFTPDEVSQNCRIARAFQPLSAEERQKLEARTAPVAAQFCYYKKPA